jgi:hypothetical protein
VESSGGTARTSKKLVWSFDHVDVLQRLPKLDLVFDCEPKEELYQIRVQYPPAFPRRPLGSGESLDDRGANRCYRVFRDGGGQVYLSSGGVAIHRIAKSTTSDVLEDALNYLKGEVRWSVFQYLASRDRRK